MTFIKPTVLGPGTHVDVFLPINPPDHCKPGTTDMQWRQLDEGKT